MAISYEKLFKVLENKNIKKNRFTKEYRIIFNNYCKTF